MKIFSASLVVLALCSLMIGCGRERAIRFEGETQGTTYHITVVTCKAARSREHLQRGIENRLAEIDLALSNYRDDSELARFNQAPSEQWIALGNDLYALLKVSRQISEQSDGAFDITVAPLVDLWGFGRRRKENFIPSDSEITKARDMVDYRQLEIDPVQPRAKKNRALTIDVNGIAQGYTVDQLANALDALGCTEYLVEVGGELRLAGLNPQRELWRIGIEKPVDGLGSAEQALRATAVGITTAGDYHDYFEKDGVRYSHTIDPRTGKPIAHKLASVTVVAVNATLADGLDTAVEVLGPETGFDFAQRHGIAAFFIVREGDRFETRYTSSMKTFLQN